MMKQTTLLKYMAVPILALSCMLPMTVNSAPLDLDLFNTPDINSQFISIDYNATTDAFTADGFALQYDNGGTHAITTGMFSLAATINSFGELQAGGTVTVTGEIAGLGLGPGTLLSGDLNAFGFKPGGGDPLEFTFDVTGGLLAADYGLTTLAGIVFSGFAGFDGSFATDFDNSIGSAQADIAQAPIPAAIWLFASALGLAGVSYRKS